MTIRLACFDARCYVVGIVITINYDEYPLIHTVLFEKTASLCYRDAPASSRFPSCVQPDFFLGSARFPPWASKLARQISNPDELLGKEWRVDPQTELKWINPKCVIFKCSLPKVTGLFSAKLLVIRFILHSLPRFSLQVFPFFLHLSELESEWVSASWAMHRLYQQTQQLKHFFFFFSLSFFSRDPGNGDPHADWPRALRRAEPDRMEAGSWASSERGGKRSESSTTRKWETEANNHLPRWRTGWRTKLVSSYSPCAFCNLSAAVNFKRTWTNSLLAYLPACWWWLILFFFPSSICIFSNCLSLNGLQPRCFVQYISG